MSDEEQRRARDSILASEGLALSTAPPQVSHTRIYPDKASALLPCRDWRKTINLRHGHTVGKQYSPTYHSWQAMLARARYVDRDIDKKHSARGITVCERWKIFDNFLADMGERPAGKTLDRYPDNDGNYEPSNCRWATPIDQARNRRNTRLTYEKAVEVAVRYLLGETAKSLAAEFCISESLPREIAKGRSWKDASEAARQIVEAQNG